MNFSNQTSDLSNREAPLEIHGDEFRELGYKLVDQIAEFLDGLSQRPVTPGESPQTIRDLLSADILPEHGSPANDLIDEVTDLLLDHSLFSGHPRFWGYITSSAAPIGALADLLAAVVNPNVGAAVQTHDNLNFLSLGQPSSRIHAHRIVQTNRQRQLCRRSSHHRKWHAAAQWARDHEQGCAFGYLGFGVSS